MGDYNGSKQAFSSFAMYLYQAKGYLLLCHLLHLLFVTNLLIRHAFTTPKHDKYDYTHDWVCSRKCHS
jgi:hypothetical protein